MLQFNLTPGGFRVCVGVYFLSLSQNSLIHQFTNREFTKYRIFEGNMMFKRHKITICHRLIASKVKDLDIKVSSVYLEHELYQRLINLE